MRESPTRHPSKHRCVYRQPCLLVQGALHQRKPAGLRARFYARSHTDDRRKKPARTSTCVLLRSRQHRRHARHCATTPVSSHLGYDDPHRLRVRLTLGSKVPLHQVESRARLMSNAYYTLEVVPCELGDDPDQWRLAVTRYAADESSATDQRLHFERFFDSQEGAVQYGSTWASAQRDPMIQAAAIEQLRRKFHGYGFDVDAYSDDQVSGALREEAAATTESRVDLFVRAFQRLRRIGPTQA